jgi:hypothetical protein
MKGMYKYIPITKEGKMKKIFSIVVMLVMFLILSSASFGGTKYDFIKKHSEWKTFMRTYDNLLVKPGDKQFVIDYLNLCVNERDLQKIVKSGKLKKDKAEFISKNSEEFLIYIHMVICKELGKLNATDAEFMYINGVIKDPYTQAAKTGPEYEMEKQVLRHFKLYNFWERLRNQNFMTKVVDEQLDIIYNAWRR